ncbi:RNA polymerase sigma-70 factor (sigma-E family) [Catenulispora sp. GAS73]|uniref:SigE family RNA polymerase sigma factor n=1 Tax=Catenulispora sp. GAS73 TaxID=3156269 RepID=UPI003511C25C
MRVEDEAEFREYVTGRWTWLVQAAVLLTGDAGHAEDLAQTALVRVFASWSRVRGAENMDAYTMRILINQNKNRFRRRRVVEDLTAAPPERGGGDATSRVDQRAGLLAALASLPKRQREVVVLRYWEDYSEAQTAQILGCSVGTVKSQASKALAKLRTHASVLASR